MKHNLNSTLLSARNPLVVGYVSALLLFSTLGAWSLGAEIAGAIVAPGTVLGEGYRQIVQHEDGGVVKAILARDGDQVVAGEILVQLDKTFLFSDLAIIQGQLLELSASAARLRAERDDLDAIRFPDIDKFDELDKSWVAEQFAGQTRLFNARKSSMRQVSLQLQEQLTQVKKQIAGTNAQLDATIQQLSLMQKDAARLEPLFTQGLVPTSRVLKLQREMIRLQGEIGRLSAQVADTSSRRAGVSIEILKLEERRREAAITTLQDLRYNRIDLEQRSKQLREKIARLDLRAPVSGVVFASQVFSLGSVILAGQPILHVVPANQPLIISARIKPVELEQVFPGQLVSLKVLSSDPFDKPDIPGIVARISPDVLVDETTKKPFFEVVILPDSTYLAAFPRTNVLPGMRVEVYLKTRNRTPLAYLMHPLTRYFNRAFRES